MVSWQNCQNAIFLKFKERYDNPKYSRFVVDEVLSEEKHSDPFSSKWGIIHYDAYMCDHYHLSEQECFACIAHELGHLLDSTSSINNMPSEERELNADKYVMELELGDELISALKKMHLDDELTAKRIAVLQESIYYKS